jgi:hypothetical protein
MIHESYMTITANPLNAHELAFALRSAASRLAGWSSVACERQLLADPRPSIPELLGFM